MNPSWGTTWPTEWHPHVYIPPQAYPQAYSQRPPQPGYWYQPTWNRNTAYQHGNSPSYPFVSSLALPLCDRLAEHFRSRKYPNLNPILASDTTLLRYDVRNMPKDAILSTTYNTNCQTPCLATPTSHIRLISKSFPWTIDVKSANGSITFEHLLDAIYYGLQEPLADSEWGMAVADKDQRETILKAAKKREEKDKDKRLKRIDWLGENILFKGLEQDGDFEKLRLLPRAQGCPETWVVRLSRGL
jgi:hypothetical protein